MHARLTCLRRRDDGASAVEYALLIAGVTAVVVLAVFVLGSNVGGLFNRTCSSWASAQSQTC